MAGPLAQRAFTAHAGLVLLLGAALLKALCPLERILALTWLCALYMPFRKNLGYLFYMQGPRHVKSFEILFT